MVRVTHEMSTPDNKLKIWRKISTDHNDGRSIKGRLSHTIKNKIWEMEFDSKMCGKAMGSVCYLQSI